MRLLGNDKILLGRVVSHASTVFCYVRLVRVALALRRGQTPYLPSAFYCCSSKRMDAALRLARHDARLLSNHLENVMGDDEEPMSTKAARSAMAALQAQGDARGDIEIKTALCLSGPVPPTLGCAADGSAENKSIESMVDVETDGEGSPLLDSSHLERSAAKEGAALNLKGKILRDSDRRKPCLDNDKMRDKVPEVSSDDEDDRVVDRRRLISILAAEERIGAMANHLGPADPTNNLRSLLLQARRSSSVPICLDVKGRDPALAENTMCVMNGKHRSVSAEAYSTPAQTATLRETRATPRFPRLSSDSSPARRNAPALPEKQRRTQSVDDDMLCTNQDTGVDSSTAAIENGSRPGVRGRGEQGGSSIDMEGCKYGRKKRCRRGDWETGSDWEDVGRVFRENSQPGESTLGFVAVDETNQQAVPEAGGIVAPLSCSLPQLKASKLGRYATGSRVSLKLKCAVPAEVQRRLRLSDDFS